MAEMERRDGEGQEHQEMAEQTQASVTDFQDRIEALSERIQGWVREQAQDRSEEHGHGRE